MRSGKFGPRLRRAPLPLLVESEAGTKGSRVSKFVKMASDRESVTRKGRFESVVTGVHAGSGKTESPSGGGWVESIVVIHGA